MAFNDINLDAIDLFCGAGGLSRGLEDSGITVRLGIELNPIAATTYKNNLQGNVIIDDIRNISSESIMHMLNINVGELFLVAGCPPCQTFSSLQKNNTNKDERNNLIMEYVRIVLELQPLFIQLENVPGLKRGRGKKIFKKATDQLSALYEINSDILNCADYGIPQKRKRLVLHGIRRDAFQLLKKSIPDFTVALPQATHSETPNNQHNNTLHPWVPARVAFNNLPAVTAGQNAPLGFPNHETNGLSPINIERIQYIQTHGGSRNCLPERLQLPCHQKNNVGYTGVYGVIDPNQPAPTMTGGCITYSKGRYGHPTQARAITVREAARLQSFTDDYIFSGTRGQAALQVGNAVPPLLAQASGTYFLNILKQLQEIPV